MASAILGKINVDLEMETASFEAAIDKTKKKTSELEKFFVNQGKNIAVGLGFGAVAAGFQSAISAANEFNAGMANIASLMPGNAEQVRQFGNAIQDLSIASGKSTADLTAGMYAVISAYGSGADAVERLRIVTETAQAGNSNSADSLKLLEAATKNYGDTSVEAMQKASDLALTAVQMGSTTFPELSIAMQNVANAAANAGVSQAELFASLSATSGVIGNASVASNKMKNALEALSKPSKDMTALYEKIGVESGKALIEQQGLEGALKIVVDTADKSKIPLGNLIGSVDGVSFATSLAGAQSEKYRETLKAMGDSAGATKRALDEQRNGLNEVGSALDRLGASKDVALQKLGDAILSAFGSNSTTAVNFMTDALTNLGKALDKMSGNNPLEEQIADMKKLKDEIAGGDLSIWDQWFGKDRKEQIAEVDEGLKKLQARLGQQISVEAKAKDAIDAKKKTEEDAAKAQGKRTEGIKLATEATKKATDALVKLKEKYSETISSIEKNKVGDAFKVAVDNQDWRALDALGDKLYTETKDSLIAGLDDSLKSNAEANAIADNMAKAISGDKVKGAYADIEALKMKAIEKEEADRIDVIQKLAKIERDEAARTQEIITNGLADAYSGIANSGTLREGIASVMQTGAQAAGAALGIPFLDKLLQPTIDRASQLGKDSEKDRNWIIGSLFTGLPPNIAEPLGGGIYTALFGGTDADSKARKRIESFLEDTLSANVEFGDGIEANWSDAFSAVAGEGQTAFETLGTAISLLAGQTADMGGQVGFILARDLNGNLDAARLLVQSLGMDAESMGAALMDAAIAGEVSWAQWAGLQAEVNNLTAEGLVGAGDLTGAWRQFVMTGGDGKDALVALSAVATEAKEAGAESIGQFQAVARQLGFAQEDIDRFVAQLQSRGVDSMSELESASNETLGSIVGGLENAGQQWEDYGEGIQGAIDQMSELEKKVRGIEDKEIDLTVNVKYRTVEGEPPSGDIQKAALGGIFDNVQKFATGGIISRPTYFGHAGGAGLAGEAGREVILPLGDGNKLRIEGLGGSFVFNYSIDARGAGAGAEAVIAQAIKSAHRAAVRDSVQAIREAQRRGAM